MTPSEHIDQLIAGITDWRGKTFAGVRKTILAADPAIIEEWKWMGSPVWSRDGIIAVANAHKNWVKLTFANGASLPDPDHIFNAGLEGNMRRAIDFFEGDTIDERALKAMVRAAIAFNQSKVKKKAPKKASAEMKSDHQHIGHHHMDRWLARGSVVLIAALQFNFVNDLSVGPVWLAPVIELALLIPLSIGTIWTQRSVRRAETDQEWRRVRKWRRFVRILAIFLTGFSTIINSMALIFLIQSILAGHAGTGRTLFIDAINIWTTNVVVFALWFWFLDRGGPASRGLVPDCRRDFLFTQQMQNDDPGFTGWLPGFIDYLFLAYTNATAFSPADSFPLTARAKLLMMAESSISLVTIAVVASRAVGILS